MSEQSTSTKSHPSYQALSSLLDKYPRAAGALFQTYNDLLYAQQWTDLEVLELKTCSRGALRGRRPRADPLLCVVPCLLSESLSISWLQSAFEELGQPSEIYLGINAQDSSVVYYKLSPGIVKPAV
ncbi:Probable tRNA-splicing endonuclease subunit [Sparassis crispa]|uniref:Probable tRNA-splicing endonuclease subunit n=1 Tax=Sparassis crispa TaxID=139825 RepID=A0A401GRJ1_9APHY|nr:Probable tRNA-splicing endonuclease subunit [Sparassis crispa]GBE84848.1 Probable tRNA-splicing endonuclease subunit [Sparassis crispa]